MSFVYDRWLFGPISLLGGGGGGGEIEWVPPNPVSPISNTIKKGVSSKQEMLLWEKKAFFAILSNSSNSGHSCFFLGIERWIARSEFEKLIDCLSAFPPLPKQQTVCHSIFCFLSSLTGILYAGNRVSISLNFSSQLFALLLYYGNGKCGGRCANDNRYCPKLPKLTGVNLPYSIKGKMGEGGEFAITVSRWITKLPLVESRPQKRN